jgi:hypothetical protein
MTQDNCCTPIGQIKRYVDCVGCDKKPRQETFEEAAAKHFNEEIFVEGVTIQYALQEAFIIGAKWQAERRYSEAIEFAEWIRIKDFQTASKNNWIGLDMKYYTTQELFEQFKKK